MDVFRALRLIEEGDSEVTDLAEALDVRRPKVRQILDRIDGIRPISDVLVEMEIERDGSRDQAEAAYVRLGGSDRPLAGRGLDEIGLFAYSRDEVDDLLALIEAALGDGDDEGGPDDAALRSAKRKLLAWRDR